MLKERGLIADTKLKFDENQHKYYFEGQELMSVTTWLSQEFVPEFNAIFASNNKAKKNKLDSTGLTNPLQLREYWRLQGKRASELGSATHTFVQMYHLDKSTKPKTSYEVAGKRAYDKICDKWNIMSVEKMVYDLDYLLAGQIDMIIQHKETGEIGVLDWKTTDDMWKSYSKLKLEMKKYEASALNKYAVQLHIYDTIGKLNVPQNNRFIVQLLESGEFNLFYSGHNQIEYQLPDISREVNTALERRKIEVMTAKFQDI